MVTRRLWTRDELLVALNLYHKLTFGQLHARNPAIIGLAEKLGRGANSVAMKLCNFASLDPALALRGVKGLEGASKLDRAIGTITGLGGCGAGKRGCFAEPVRRGRDQRSRVLPKKVCEFRKRLPSGPTEVAGSAKFRRGQEYFRDAVLNNFGGRCGVSQLPVRELLIASHILPWGKYPAERLNVRNGICLSRLHDAAFDRGLISFDDELRLVLSPTLKHDLAQCSVADNFGKYAGEPLRLPPDAALPELAFLAEHRARVFRR